jgi:hypothetical protein
MPSPTEIQKYLKGVEYPASKEDLVSAAEENDAPEEVIDALEDLNEDEFAGPADVQKAAG